ncbi:MAG: hypothetical protein UH854_01520, partial [Clostridia bacterium]|nr:hypothetical protein [Clostridia bacterium]
MRMSTLLTLYILIGLVLMPQICMGAAVNGINLCLGVVVPSLFPFFICSKILVKNGFAQMVSKPLHFIMRPVFNVPGCGAFVFVLGILSGCPVGAKTVTDIFSRNMCTRAEAQRMLCFCNNSGPLFVIGSVAIGMLGFEEVGIILYLSHIISAVLVGILMRFYKRSEAINKTSYYNNDNNTDILSSSVTESVSLTGYVCGFIIFFSVAIEIFKQSGLVEILCQRFYDKNIMSGALYGMLEMTNGISALSSLAITPQLLGVVSFVLGFGGLSVILQVYGIIKKYNLSIVVFSVAKLIQGFVSGIITHLLL